MRAPYGRDVTVYTRTTAARPVWPHVPAQWRLRRWLAPRRDVLVAPACGAVVLAGLRIPATRLRIGLLGFCALAVGASVTRRVAPQAALLPLMRHVYRFIGPALGLVLHAVIGCSPGRPRPGRELWSPWVTGLVAEPWAGLRVPALGGARAAYIGSPTPRSDSAARSRPWARVSTFWWAA